MWLEPERLLLVVGFDAAHVVGSGGVESGHQHTERVTELGADLGADVSEGVSGKTGRGGWKWNSVRIARGGYLVRWQMESRR